MKSFQNESIQFQETIPVKEGVSCDVYSYENSKEKDLGIITVDSGKKTPLQKVLKGDKTLEGFMSGSGILTVKKESGEEVAYEVDKDSDVKEVEVKVGQYMQWEATGDGLIFYEICYPPYEDGRYENIEE